MTAYDIIVPAAALAVAGVFALIVKLTDKPASKRRPGE